MDHSPFLKRILFCAAFFPGLSADEFRKVCLILAGDDTVFMPEGNLDSMGRLAVFPQKTTLEQAWKDRGDGLLNDCGLRDVEGEAGIFSVAFQRPEEKEGILREIERMPNFFGQSANKLWEAGLAFDPGATEELVDGMTGLFAAALGRRAVWQRPEWLALTLVQHLSDGRADDLDELLAKVALDNFVLERISRLLRSVLADRRYARFVELWLNDLLARRGHGHALRLAEHLRHATGFKYLDWLKRLANEGPASLQPEVYRALLSYAKQSAVQIWEILEGVRSWLPDYPRTAGALSNSNRNALRLMVDYPLDSGRNLSFDDMAMWPSRYALFRDFALTSDEADPKKTTDARLRMLVEWLFHPALEALFDSDLPGVWGTRGRITLLWAYVLRGLDLDATPALALECYTKLITLCAERTELKGRRQLFRVWSEERDMQSQRSPGMTESQAKTRRLAGEFIDRLEEDFRRAVENCMP